MTDLGFPDPQGSLRLQTSPTPNLYTFSPVVHPAAPCQCPPCRQPLQPTYHPFLWQPPILQLISSSQRQIKSLDANSTETN